MALANMGLASIKPMLPMKQTSLVLLISLVSLMPTSFAVWADPIEERESVIARYLEWRGGEAFADVTSIFREGQLEVAGFSGPVELYQLRDGRQYLHADLEVFEITEVLLPEASWLINPSGQVEDMGSLSEIYARRSLAHDLALPLFEPGSEVILKGEEEHDGRAWAVLRVAYEDGDYRDLFIDRTTGALEWVRVQRDREVFWLQFENWSVVDRVRLPGVRREFHESESRNATYAWSSYQINTPVREDLFRRPTAESRATIAGNTKSTGWIPFDFYRRQRIFLPAKVNGTETLAILDSGAEMTALDPEVARAAGLTGSGSVAAEGTGGAAEVQFASGATIQIGDLQLHNMTVAILDLSELGRRLLGRPIPVILGKEVFNEMIVDIDYPNRRIAFHEPGQWSYTGGETVPLPELADSRVVEISVEGEGPILANFDIGQGSTLTLFEAYVEETDLVEGRRTSNRLGGGVGGETLSTVTTFRTLTLGGFEFEDVPVSLPIGAEGAFDTIRHQGNLGTEILSRFRLIVNYGDDEIYLEPDRARFNAEFDRDRAGLQLQIEERGGEVIHVMASSPAEKLGLAAGTIVQAINGRSISDDYWTGDLWRWPYAAAGSVVRLTLADGREMELALADFY